MSLWKIFSSIMSCITEEVLNIINEPDRDYDVPLDMSGIDIMDVLEEEEVEYEYLESLFAQNVDIYILKSTKRVYDNCAHGEHQPMRHRHQQPLKMI